MQLTYSEQTIYKHTGDHISHADLAPLLHIDSWSINSGEQWAVIGGHEEQRSALLELLSETVLELEPGITISEISPREQQRLIDTEIIKGKSGVADEISHGTPVLKMLLGNECETFEVSQKTMDLVEQLNFGSCLPQYFRQLSSGETRRLLLIRALQHNSKLLLLQDPLEGLDVDTRPVARELLDSALNGKQTDQTVPPISIFIASRPEQALPCTTHIAYIEKDHLKTVALQKDRPQSIPETLQALRKIITPVDNISIPPLPEDHPFHKHSALNPASPLVKMINVSVSYADVEQAIFENLNWTVMPYEHWRVTGPNGSGKTTLLKLITGDHPQVYRNHVEVCGFRRGSGESVWEVKRHIGYMSGEMLWNYRGSGQLAGRAQDVIISGLYDSIGLYTKPNSADRQTAIAWLDLFELTASARRRFQSLSIAEQRLVLIARSMIKRPALLILDEPLQGLDGEDRIRVLKIVEKLIGANATTLLYVSHHDDEQVEGVSNALQLGKH